MGRPRKHATADGEALRNSVDAAELRSFIERVESVNNEIADLNSDRRAIFAEVKAAGYDVATVRTIIKRREIHPDVRAEQESLLDQYMTALGDFAGTPLGQAGAERIREGARV
jgi:uncharacterized protein (UPF0335 family)